MLKYKLVALLLASSIALFAEENVAEPNALEKKSNYVFIVPQNAAQEKADITAQLKQLEV